MVIEQYLKAHIAGLGRGETSVFPIVVFGLKKGVNFNKEDPNYDLFRLAMECSSKRQFPTYSFQDASFNLPFYERDNIRGIVGYMGKCKCSPCKIGMNPLFTGCAVYTVLTGRPRTGEPVPRPCIYKGRCID